MFRNSVIHKIFSELLQPFRVCRNDTGLPVLDRDRHFYLVLGFWLAWSTAALLRFQKSTGLPVLAFQHVYLTQLRDLSSHRLGIYPTQLKMSCLVEVDELEEDVG